MWKKMNGGIGVNFEKGITMKAIIADSREITEYELLLKAIKKSGFSITEIISGCTRGVDKLGEKYAIDHHWAKIKFELKSFRAVKKQSHENANKVTRIERKI